MFGAKTSSLPVCNICGNPRRILNDDGICLGCVQDMRRDDPLQRRNDDEKRAVEREEQRQRMIRSVQITTEAWVGDVDRLGVVAAEVVLGMNIFKDVMANVRDIVGGRSGTVQETFDEARSTALDEVRVKASEIGADAVIAISISYHTISTGPGLNMMMVAVTGTAVRMGAARTA